MTEMTKTHKSESEIALPPVINGLHHDYARLRASSVGQDQAQFSDHP